jgi:drug/metabolite transporter (DMT)-like permease
MRLAGELAALGTAVCWAAGSIFFAAAGRRMGSAVLNRLRITVAALFLMTALVLVDGSPWPTWATPLEVGLLSASGLIGYVFGDNNYFRSLVILGPGRAALLASAAPIFTALLGLRMLDERLGGSAWLGMVLTLGGLAWALTGPGSSAELHVEGSALVGVVAGLLGAFGQAGGYVLSKLALMEGLDPLPASVVRVVAGTAGVWLLALLGGGVRHSLAALRRRDGSLFMIGGAFCGPFLGVTLSLLALEHTEAGVAASITAIFPILTLVLASRFYGERITARVLGGAVVSLAGVVVLFLR